jgi:uncharacterized membrane protein
VQVLGLLTRGEFAELPDDFAAGQDLVAVYIPFSYAMGGVTTLVPRSAVRPVSMSMEEAMRFAITAGMAVKPPENAAVAPRPGPMVPAPGSTSSGSAGAARGAEPARAATIREQASPDGVK